MPNVKVVNMQGAEVGEMTLSDKVFGAEVNGAVLHTAVRAYLMNQRQGTQSALTRTEVSGGGKKPWRQKGTASPCVFTKGIETVRLPIRHGEGKFVADEAVLAEIEAKNLVAVRYCSADGSAPNGFPENPNGSLNDIAGICDETGRIFGLMPHPEAFLSPFNAPDWQTQKLEGKLPEWGEGRIIFENAVAFAAENLG